MVGENPPVQTTRLLWTVAPSTADGSAVHGGRVRGMLVLHSPLSTKGQPVDDDRKRGSLTFPSPRQLPRRRNTHEL